ncbi:hypothetical protein [Geothermobacter ehrlichii]|uniref:hypothetical protein n=1 Tax=Geothermobacter ehrlichii TaxID=213224 RepID=UPI00165328BF|nr:hypothetical protein [Geothermobacter ehrlichii]
MVKHIFDHAKLPSERRLPGHLASYKDSDLAGLKQASASLRLNLMLLTDTPLGKIPLDIDSRCFSKIV